MILLELFALFAAGMFQEALNTVYVRSVAERLQWRATVLSGLLTVLGFVVFARIVTLIGPELGAASGSIVAYALGNSAGTWVGVRRAGTAA